MRRRKYINGIYGGGDVPEMGQLAIEFQGIDTENDKGIGGAQLAYEEWEELWDKGSVEVVEWVRIELDLE